MGILGMESPILGNFAPPEVQNPTNRRAAASIADRRQSPSNCALIVAILALGMCGYTAPPKIDIFVCL